MAELYAPVPNRAFLDRRLTGMHFRVLGCIAMHDRMGLNGRHCMLSTRRLGMKIGSDGSNVAASIRELVEWGYLQRFANPEHRQRQQLAVVYEAKADAAALSVNRGSAAPQEGGPNPGSAEPHIRDTLERDIIDADETGPMGSDHILDNSPASIQEVFGKLNAAIKDNAAFVATLDRFIKQGWRFLPEEAESIRGHLDHIHSMEGHTSKVGGWAYALIETDMDVEEAA